MRLGEELRLGSLLVMKPEAGDVRACAIGMANLAIGYRATSEGERAAYHKIVHRHPWIRRTELRCPLRSCNFYEINRVIERCEGSEAIILYHPFDSHVMKGEMTIEQLAD